MPVFYSLSDVAHISSLACLDASAKSGADDRDRTGDLVLTKDALCQLSYIGLRARLAFTRASARQVGLTLLRARRASLASARACRAEAHARPSRASEGWSGRRGSNPRPTAWKAVTLPLSYSRLRGSLASPTRRFGGQARLFLAIALSALRRARPPRSRRSARRSRTAFAPPLDQPSLACSSRAAADLLAQAERRLVARGGFEPPKPLGRQIYSLLRLTAPQPRRRHLVDAAVRATTSTDTRAQIRGRRWRLFVESVCSWRVP